MQGLRSARLAFAGTPAFAVPTLNALAQSGAEIPLVLTQPDRPSGRGRRAAASPVKSAALELGLRLAQPAALHDPGALASWGEPPDALVVVAYGLILPRWLLDWPRVACINLHASLLPRWRGAAPIQHAILAGDSVTGVSLMRMERGLDTGPVYARRGLEIGARESAAELGDRLSTAGAELVREILPDIVGGRLAPAAQDDAQATLAPKIAKGDAPLDWGREAMQLERQVRAYDPWPVAEGRLDDGQRLRIWRAVAIALEQAAAPGAVVGTGPAGIDVAAGRGALRIERLQAPGARPMAAAAYLAAHDLEGAAFVREAPARG